MRRRVEVPIAADESIRRAADPYRVRDLEAADIAVLKVQPLGGVRACLRIAEDIGLPVVVSSAVESSVGIAAGRRAGRGAARAAARLRARHRAAAHRRRRRRPAAPGRRRPAGTPPGGRPGRLAGAAPPRPDRAEHWRRRMAEVEAVRQDRRRDPVHAASAATALATWLVDELVERGLTDVVLCPGSRNAPLSFALLGRRRGSRCTPGSTSAPPPSWRSAWPRRSHRPAAVVTTSGTAAANLHPAVLEAAHAGVPLVAVTADRPARLRGTGANQTTDQVRLFGDAASFVDLTDPDDDALDAAWHPGGPIHLNVQLDDPLLPGTVRIVRCIGPSTAVRGPNAGTIRGGRRATEPIRLRARPAHGRGGRGRRRSARAAAGRAGRLAAAGRAEQRVPHGRERDPHLPAAARHRARRAGRAGRRVRAPDAVAAGAAAAGARGRRGGLGAARAVAGRTARSPVASEHDGRRPAEADDPAWLEEWRAADRALGRPDRRVRGASSPASRRTTSRRSSTPPTRPAACSSSGRATRSATST